MATRKPPAELRAVRCVADVDSSSDVSYLEQDGFEERLASYKRGQLHLVEVWLEADVALEDDVQATVRSPGVGGVESDTPEEEIVHVMCDEWKVLRASLKRMGVATEQLPLEVDREWIEWRM